MKRSIGTFGARVSPSKYKKKLKDEVKEYRYGSITVTTPELTEYIGQEVAVKILKVDKTKGKK